MIKFLVCSDLNAGHIEALARGWLPIAARRYVENYEGLQAERREIRLVRRLSDFQWTPGLVLLKSGDFGVCASCRGNEKLVPRCRACEGSGRDPEAGKFEALVAEGHARWEELGPIWKPSDIQGKVEG